MSDRHQPLGPERPHSGVSRQGWGQDRSAVLGMMGSAFSFSLMAVCVKQLGGRLPVAELVLARALVSVVLSWLLLRQAGVFPWGQRRGLLVIRGLVGSLALLCVYLAITRLPLASSTVLQYLYPSITALLAWPWLGERLRRRSLLGLALGWLGVLLVCQPAGGLGLGLQLFPGASPLPVEGTLAALAGALLTALAYVSVRDLGRSEHPLVIVFYFPLVSVPFSLPLVLLQPVWPAPQDWIWLLGVGMFTQLGQLGVTLGLTQLPAARATTISYMQVAFAALWGWWLFGETVNGWTSLGALLILAAALVGR